MQTICLFNYQILRGSLFWVTLIFLKWMFVWMFVWGYILEGEFDITHRSQPCDSYCLLSSSYNQKSLSACIWKRYLKINQFLKKGRFHLFPKAENGNFVVAVIEYSHSFWVSWNFWACIEKVSRNFGTKRPVINSTIDFWVNWKQI